MKLLDMNIKYTFLQGLLLLPLILLFYGEWNSWTNLNIKYTFPQGLLLLLVENGAEEVVMLMVQVKMQSFLVILMWFILEVAALFWLSTEETMQFGRSNSTMMIVLTTMMVVSI